VVIGLNLMFNYPPFNRFLNGSGWFKSPAGAIPSNPNLQGRVVFNLLAKYTRWGSHLLGSNNFVLLATRDSFHSTRLNWLVITNTEAILRGEGSLNGQSGYQFMVTVTDDPDTIHLKIWKETDGQQVVYDNIVGQPLSGGRIVIH
jgi:hypothetical protein